jgi:TonB family protein
MRPLTGIVFALVLLVSSVHAQTESSQAAPPQTARQALIEMLFGQAPNHLEKHLPEVTRQAFENLKGAGGQSFLGEFSMFAKQAEQGKDKFEIFDTGPTLFTAKDLPGGNYEKMDVTVERDDLTGDEDQIELAMHMTRGGKEEALPFILRITFSMKMESDVWRLNEIGLGVRLPLADPAFLKSLLERQRSQNEQMAIWSMRSVLSAEKSYQASQGSYACTLSALGSASKETGAAHRAYLYDSQLASGKKNGYIFAISGCNTSHYQLIAEPAVPDSGQRAFCSDESATVRASADGKASTCLSSGEVAEDSGLIFGARGPVAVEVPANARPIVGAAPQSHVASGTLPAERIRVSQGVATGLIISKVAPVYPEEARTAKIQGSVVLKAMINQTGDVVSLDLVSGHPLLAPAAMDAVRQWKYRPYLLNGKAVAVETQITVNFTLTKD